MAVSHYFGQGIDGVILQEWNVLAFREHVEQDEIAEMAVVAAFFPLVQDRSGVQPQLETFNHPWCFQLHHDALLFVSEVPAETIVEVWGNAAEKISVENKFFRFPADGYSDCRTK